MTCARRFIRALAVLALLAAGAMWGRSVTHRDEVGWYGEVSERDVSSDSGISAFDSLGLRGPPPARTHKRPASATSPRSHHSIFTPSTANSSNRYTSEFPAHAIPRSSNNRNSGSSNVHI
jgi:hypothetical protein